LQVFGSGHPESSIFGCIRRFGVQLDVLLARVARMLVGMDCVAVGHMRVMRRRFAVAFAYVFRRSAVVFGGFFVVLGRLLVQFLEFFHDRSSVKYIYSQ
jgi:hypothetical protein